MSRLVIVGESNPYGRDPSMALFHLPRHASGDRLREHLGLTDATYEALDKVNLCAGKWSMAEARRRADELVPDYQVLVLLGAKVRAVFGGRGGAAWGTTANVSPFCAQHRSGTLPGPYHHVCTLVALPHPSGLSRAWNEPGARLRARSILAKHAPWVPWGEVP